MTDERCPRIHQRYQRMWQRTQQGTTRLTLRQFSYDMTIETPTERTLTDVPCKTHAGDREESGWTYVHL